MFHSVGRIMGWAKNYRKRMILGFVCSFFATWCTAGPVMLAAWALGRLPCAEGGRLLETARDREQDPEVSGEIRVALAGRE